MATFESTDSNLLDAETVNWRLVVYPLLAVILLLLGGFGYYFYLQNVRIVNESDARAAMLQAKTPEALIQIADKFPGTDQANIALISAADLSFGKKDYAAAISDYQRVTGASGTNEQLRDAAQLGLASTLEASGKPGDAVTAYLVVAHRGKDSPFAPAAYTAAAAIYEQQGDKANEQATLLQEVSLDADSAFVKEAQMKLKALMTPATASGTIEKK